MFYCSLQSFLFGILKACMSTFELRAPRTDGEWQKMHELRIKGIFSVHMPGVAYSYNHPNDHSADNHPLILLVDGEVVGTTRIDRLNEKRAILRLVAIDEEKRGKGLGTKLLELAEDYAQDHGFAEFVVWALEDAVPFYEKCGYHFIEPFEEKAANPTGALRDFPMGKAFH